MKRIINSMNSTTTQCIAKASTARMYAAIVTAATSTNPDDVASSKAYAANMQAQCLKLISRLSDNQEVHRSCDGDELEYVDSEYSDLIQFISGVGASCAEMSARLSSAKHENDTDARPLKSA